MEYAGARFAWGEFILEEGAAGLALILDGKIPLFTDENRKGKPLQRRQLKVLGLFVRDPQTGSIRKAPAELFVQDFKDALRWSTDPRTLATHVSAIRTLIRHQGKEPDDYITSVNGRFTLVAEARRLTQEPGSDPLSGLCRTEGYHRYHLTEDKVGPFWIYAALRFSESGDPSAVQAWTVLLPRGVKAERESRYRYHVAGRVFGEHLMLTIQSEKIPRNDVAVEMFPDFEIRLLRDEKPICGARINDTFRENGVASSIVILSPTKLIDVEPGSFPVSHPGAQDLQRLWDEESRIVRLPESAPSAAAVGQVATEPSLAAFWKPYLYEDRSRQRLLYYGEPLFWRNADHTEYGRTIRVDESDSYDRVEGRFPSRAYLNAGEVRCMLTLIRWFAERGVRLQEIGRRFEHKANDVTGGLPQERDAHGIILGAPRLNGMAHGYLRQLKLKFKIGSRGIRYTGEDGVRYALPDIFFADRSSPTKAFVLVTRTQGLAEDRTAVTLISANIGRAIQQMGTALISDSFVKEIQEQLAGDSWPKCFQLLFQATLSQEETIASVPELVGWWMPEQNSFFLRADVRESSRRKT
jgi:hypothetical protein